MRQRAALLFLAAVLVLLAGCGGELRSEPGGDVAAVRADSHDACSDRQPSGDVLDIHSAGGRRSVPARRAERDRRAGAGHGRGDREVGRAARRLHRPEGARRRLRCHLHARRLGSARLPGRRRRLRISSASLRDMPRGACHEALGAHLDALRGFWQGAAPLDLEWLDQQQRPPVLYDLDSAVALIRPVPARIRHAVTTACSG